MINNKNNIGKFQALPDDFTFINKEKKIKFGKPEPKKEIQIKDLKPIKKESKKEINKSINTSKFNEDGFVFKSEFNNKISINKFKLRKAIKFDERKILLSSISYDSKVKDEDKTVKEMQTWLDDQRKEIEKELKLVYKGSF